MVESQQTSTAARSSQLSTSSPKPTSIKTFKGSPQRGLTYSQLDEAGKESSFDDEANDFVKIDHRTMTQYQ
jgi:hypothetical protein